MIIEALVETPQALVLGRVRSNITSNRKSFKKVKIKTTDEGLL